MDYELTWRDRSAIIRLYGSVDDRTLASYQTDIFGNPRFDTLKSIIWNGLEIENWDVDERALNYCAALSIGGMQVNPSIKIAFVFNLPIIANAVAEYTKLTTRVSSDWQIATFDNLEEATQWAKTK